MSETKRPLTLGELAAGVRDDLFQWDRGLVGTFIGLLWKPGRVIRGFIEDRDERYAKPWRYLIFGVLANVAATWFVLDNLGYRERLGLGGQSEQIAFLLDNAAVITLVVLPLVALSMRLCFIGLNVRYIDALVALFYTQGQVNLFGVASVAAMALLNSQAANPAFVALTLIYFVWAWSSFASGPIWRRVLASVLTLVLGQVINGVIVYGVVTYFG
ncbi:MAG: DUF3667 domain-containing protein [Hyphomonadaceae bacterium]